MRLQLYATALVAVAILGHQSHVEAAPRATVQRMRIPSGQYVLSGKGGTLPARCLDMGLPAPNPSVKLFGPSRLAREQESFHVIRERNNVREEKPLSEVRGKWIELTGDRGPLGDGSADAVRYRILEDGYKYTLHAREGMPGVLGESEDMATAMAKQLLHPEIAKALQDLDKSGSLIRRLFGDTRTEYETFNKLKQDIEWRKFGKRSAPDSVKAFLESYRAKLRETYVGQTEVSADEVARRLAVRMERDLTPADRKDAEDLLGVELPTTLGKQFLSELANYQRNAEELRKAASQETWLADCIVDRSVARFLRTGRLAEITAGVRHLAQQISEVVEYKRQLQTLFGELSPESALVRNNILAVDFFGADLKSSLRQVIDDHRESLHLKFVGKPGASAEEFSCRLTIWRTHELDQSEKDAAKKLFSVQIPDVLPLDFQATWRDYTSALADLRAHFSPETLDQRFVEAALAQYVRSGRLDAAIRWAANEIIEKDWWFTADFPRDYLFLSSEVDYSVSQIEVLKRVTGYNLDRARGTADQFALLTIATNEAGKKEIVLRRADRTIVVEPSDLIKKGWLRSELGDKRLIIDDRPGRGTFIDERTGQRENLQQFAENQFIPFRKWSDFRDRVRRKAFEQQRSPKNTGSPWLAHDHVGRDPQNTVEVRYVNLQQPKKNEGIGDAIVIHGNDGQRPRTLIVDMGLDQVGLREILKNLPKPRGNEPPIVDIIITHDHADHMANLPGVLADREIQVDQVFIGFMDKSGDRIKEILKIIDRAKAWTIVGDGEHFLIRRQADAQKPLRITDVPLGTNRFKRWEICPTPDLRIEVIQYQEPTDKNDAALVLKLHHRGITQLLTSDVEPAVIRAMINDPAIPREFFSCDILKWPHHVSFPANWSQRDKGAMQSLLLLARPHTIVFSNTGMKQTKKMQEEAIDFIDGVLNPTNLPKRIRFEWNRTEGTLRFLTREDGSRGIGVRAQCGSVRQKQRATRLAPCEAGNGMPQAA